MLYKIYKNNDTYYLRKENDNFVINNSNSIPTTPTSTKTPTPTSSVVLTVTPSLSATSTPTITPSISQSIEPTVTPSTSLSATPTVTPSTSLSATPTVTPSTSLSATPTVTPSTSLSATPTVTPSTSLSATPTVTPSISLSVTPTITPSTSPLSFRTSNTANYNSCASWDSLNGNITSIGTNGNNSAYGAYDMNGNVWEWTERLWNAGARGVKGGSWASNESRLLRTFEGIQQPVTILNQIGFRVASSLAIPNIIYITIVDTNNSNDDSGIGSVPYVFTLGKFAVTNNEYAEFLNSIASTDLYGLYDTSMSSNRGGILRSETNGSYVYSVKNNYENKPVVNITWYNAARYCNWLHNNKPSGSQNNSTTENGSYQLTGNTGSPTRQIGAKYFIPSGDEWQKAAFYKGGANTGYWNYATQNNTAPICVSSNSSGNGI